jgi:hypothetical protein
MKSSKPPGVPGRWAGGWGPLCAALGLMVFACMPASAEQPKPDLQFGETSAYVLSVLLLDKARGSIQWSAVSVENSQQLEADLVMLYRLQVIRCGGFLDELAPVLALHPDVITSIRRTENNAAMTSLEKMDSILSSMRRSLTDLDSRAERFSGARLAEVMRTLASGNWQIQPSCLAPGYAASVAQLSEEESRH